MGLLGDFYAEQKRWAEAYNAHNEVLDSMRHLFDEHRSLMDSQKLIIAIQAVTTDLRALGRPSEASKVFQLVHKAGPSVNPFNKPFRKPHWAYRAKPKPRPKTKPQLNKIKLKPGQKLTPDGIFTVESKE